MERERERDSERVKEKSFITIIDTIKEFISMFKH